MDGDHHIAFVILQYEKGYRVVYFDKGEKPEVKFYQRRARHCGLCILQSTWSLVH